MVIIEGLKDVPDNCEHCACYNPPCMYGPGICFIKMLIMHDFNYYTVNPSLDECPLKKVSDS